MGFSRSDDSAPPGLLKWASDGMGFNSFQIEEDERVCVYKNVEIDAIEGNKYIYIYMFSNMNSFELDPSEK